MWGPSEADLGDSCGQGERQGDVSGRRTVVAIVACVVACLLWFGHRISHAKSKVKNFLVRGFLGDGLRTRDPEGQREAEGSEREQEAQRPVPNWAMRVAVGRCYWGMLLGDSTRAMPGYMLALYNRKCWLKRVDRCVNRCVYR